MTRRTQRSVAMAPALLASVVCLLNGTPACAERLQILASVGSEGAWTSSAELGRVGPQDDTVISVRPRIEVRGEGARLRFAGFAALNAVTYAGGTQDNRVLPEADLQAKVEAIERLFFVEAALRATQTVVNPFGIRPDAASTQNRLSTAQARLSPSIERAIDAQSRFRLRSDHVLTRESGDDGTESAGSGSLARYSAVVEQDPRPLGWRLEAERSETDYDEGALPRLRSDLLRASVERVIAADFVVGIQGGVERNSFVVSDESHTIYGFQLGWRPSDRTLLAATIEERYFGTGWRVAFNHRQPRLAFRVLLSRVLATTPQALLDAPPIENLAALFDAMFTTRIPDPDERARAVQEFLVRNALPSATLAPLDLFSRRISLVTTRSALVALNGARSSLSLSVFRSTTEDAPDILPAATGSVLDNNVQTGASVVFSHRLTKVTSASAALDWSRVVTLTSEDHTRQVSARVQLGSEIGPKTSVVGGLRWRDIDSSVVASGHERVVFVGIDHRF